MTVPSSINPEQFLNEQLAQARPDLMREMLSMFIGLAILFAIPAVVFSWGTWLARSALRRRD